MEVDSTLSKDNQVYLIIDEKEYPTILSQIAIINYIELITDNEVILFYCVGNNGGYFTAKEFRIAYGYDNKFFEKE